VRLVLGVDGSGGAEVAARLIQGTAWPGGTTVRLVSALGGASLALPAWPTPGEGVALAARVGEALRLEHEELAAALRAHGLVTTSAIVGGRPASAILDEAHAAGADMIIVGSRGLGSIGSLLLGSVSTEVVERSPVPVLVARTDRVGRVLLAMDGSAMARAAERTVRALPMFRGVEVSVVTVAGEDDVPAGASVAEAAALRLRQSGLIADARIRRGEPAAGILEAARDVGADLIIVGSRGLSGLKRLALGSVSRNVLAAAPVSVLVVRSWPPRRDSAQ
jgi:nucleotide-binding universal stress UspA family protein